MIFDFWLLHKMLTEFETLNRIPRGPILTRKQEIAEQAKHALVKKFYDIWIRIEFPKDMAECFLSWNRGHQLACRFNILDLKNKILKKGLELVYENYLQFKERAEAIGDDMEVWKLDQAAAKFFYPTRFRKNFTYQEKDATVEDKENIEW